jgi:subtilisin family serine protease
VQVNVGTVYNDAFATAVQLLRARGIPVIASAGNAQSRSGVAWPACIPGVVKVGAMLNVADITAFSIPQFNTNLVSVVPSDPGNPAHPFVGEHFFLGSGASGASGAIGVLSSRASTQFPYGRDNGTSFAAPQVTGAYAVVKAAYRKLGLPYQVDWASLWLRSSASLDVEDGFDLANPKRKHKAIRFTAVP